PQSSLSSSSLSPSSLSPSPQPSLSLTPQLSLSPSSPPSLSPSSQPSLSLSSSVGVNSFDASQNPQLISQLKELGIVSLAEIFPQLTGITLTQNGNLVTLTYPTNQSFTAWVSDVLEFKALSTYLPSLTLQQASVTADLDQDTYQLAAQVDIGGNQFNLKATLDAQQIAGANQYRLQNFKIDNLEINSLKTWLVSQATGLSSYLPASLNGNINLELLGNGIELVYQGNFPIAEVVNLVPEVKNLASSIAFPTNLTVTNPSLTILNPESDPSFLIKAEQLPKPQLLDWIKSSAAAQLPNELKTSLEQLLGLVSNVDVQFSSDQLQITYLGNIQSNQVAALIPAVKDLTASLGLPNLSITNPRVTILHPQTKPTFEFTAEKIPVAQVKDWLKTQALQLLPADLKTNLDTLLAEVQNLDLQFESDRLTVSYLGDFNVTKVASFIPGVKELVNQVSLPTNWLLTNPSLTVINPKTNPSYELSVERLPKEEVINWVQSTATQFLPEELKSAVGQLSALTSNVEFVLGQNQIDISYLGSLNLTQVANLIPGVKDLATSLSLPSLPIVNPSLTIFNPKQNPSFALAVESLPVTQIKDWLKNQALNLLPTNLKSSLDTLLAEVQNIDLEIGSDNLKIGYLGNFNITKVAGFIPGVKDIISELSLPDLKVLNPTLNIVNPKTNPSYDFSVDRLPIAEVKDWLKAQAFALLPADLKTSLDTLLNEVKNIDLQLGTDEVKIGYLGDFNITKVAGFVPGVKEIISSLSVPNLLLTNPSITIHNPKTKPTYDFSVDSLPIGAVKDWLKTQALNLLPAEVKPSLDKLLNSVQNIDLEFGANRVDIKYLGDFSLTQVAGFIPSVQETLEDLAFPNLAVKNPSLTILNPKINPSYSFAVEELPKDELIQWVKTEGANLLPTELKEVVERLSNLVKNVDLQLGEQEIKIGYIGDLPLKNVASLIPGVKDLATTLDLPNLPVSNPSLTILSPKLNPSFNLNADSLPIAQVKDWLKNQALKLLPADLKPSLDTFLAEVENLDLQIGDNAIQVKYLGDFKATKVASFIPGVKDLVSSLALPDLNTTNPSLTILSPTQNPSFNFAADSLPIAQVKDWIKTQALKQLPTDLKSSLETLLNEVQNLDLEFESDRVLIKYLGDFNLTKVAGFIPGVKDLIGQLGLPNLNITNPSLTILNPKLKPSYSFAAERLPKEELLNWIKSSAINALPAELKTTVEQLVALASNIDLRLGSDQLNLTYKGIFNS
ncbi:MAG: hypothetical protein ACKO2V_00610, partial [Snowella sp.]